MIKLIILFGSRAKGQVGKMSDVDIAVLGDSPLNLSENVELSQRIAKKLKVSEDLIDVVDLSTASPLLQFEVTKYGKLIEGSESDFVRFKILAWKRYQDTSKFRRMRENYLTQSVRG